MAPDHPELFVAEEALARLQVDAAGGGDAVVQLALAWQLRQRDTARAEATLKALALPAGGTLATRAALIRAEGTWLAGDIDAARAAVEEASRTFQRLDDAVGLGDARWLAAAIAQDSGDRSTLASALRETIAAYERTDDRERLRAAWQRRNFYDAFFEPQEVRRRLEAEDGADLPPAAAGWRAATLAILQGQQGRLAEAIGQWIRAHDGYLASGQLRQAIVAASNVGLQLSSLNDANAGLEWLEKALEMARRAGWPSSIGTCLCFTADAIRTLGQPAQALALAREAVERMQRFEGSHNYMESLHLLGECLMETGDPLAALACFERCEALAGVDGLEAQFRSRSSQAAALARLGRHAEAAASLESALALARRQGNAEWQVSALRVLASLKRAAPEAVEGVDALSSLREAHALASGLAGFHVPAGLCDELAAEYAGIGQFEPAYRLAREADRARETLRSEAANQRVAALQVRHEVERLRSESAHHRELGRLQAERADELQRSVTTLEELGAVGREVTASLEAEALCAALDRHVRRMLGATGFALHRTGEGAGLDAAFVSGPDGAMSDESVFPHGAPEAARLLAAVEGLEDEDWLHVPLVAAGRLVGLMSARLAPADRGDRPRAILRTLSSYATIALANVDAMAALRGAERVLARQNAELERLADTDRLTGLYNRRFLDRALQAEFATARRYGTPFSIIIIDLDHFKQVNDTWGHLAGDEVLAVTAGMIRKRARETDVVGRWGGEEFVVICPRTDRDGARAVAEAMRERVQSHEFAQAGRRTASIGTATWRAGDDAASLTHRADEALYAAKEGGRNRVVQAAA